jgi:hypothetical protein
MKPVFFGKLTRKFKIKDEKIHPTGFGNFIFDFYNKV